MVDGTDVVAEVHEVLDKMAAFATQVRSGEWRGFTGLPITAVVNIGIGGSDLGPVMAYEALRFYADPHLTFRFVSNVDSTDFAEATRDLDPAQTLFVVSSKTFTTLETLTNARSARDWLTSRLGDEAAVARHFVAVSTNTAKVAEFGIDTANMFGFWDWVGGRYSMDSAIGLSTMIAIGPDRFAEMLAGFHEMDEHFRTAPLASEPSRAARPAHGLVRGLLRRRQHRRAALRAVPQAVPRLPAAADHGVQRQARQAGRDAGQTTPQARSSGASQARTASTASTSCCTRAHSIIPVDLIGFGRSLNPIRDHHDLLMSNVFAQAQAFAFGKTLDEVLAEGTDPAVAPHRVMEGNRPSNVILAEVLTPRLLGSLVALYEHAVFTAGTIWNIDSFDQWGVELGKVLAAAIIPELTSGPSLRSSTIRQRIR